MTGRVPYVQQITRVIQVTTLFEGVHEPKPQSSSSCGLSVNRRTEQGSFDPPKKAPWEGKNQTWSIWLLWHRPVGEPKSVKCYDRLAARKRSSAIFSTNLPEWSDWRNWIPCRDDSSKRGRVGGWFFAHLSPQNKSTKIAPNREKGPWKTTEGIMNSKLLPIKNTVFQTMKKSLPGFFKENAVLPILQICMVDTDQLTPPWN